ncbi:hemolysin family protein [Jatrophihabitans sp. YIM 134969]
MTAALLLLAAFALVATCGVFVAGEFALLAVDRRAVEKAAEEGDRRAKGTLLALRSLSTQLAGVQIGITVTNLAIGFLAEPAIGQLIEGPLTSLGVPEGAVSPIAVVIALTVSTGVTMILGELIPKNLAIAAPIATAYAVQGPIRVFTTAIHLPIRALNSFANALLHRFGLEAKEELASARSADELLSVVRHSAAEGALESETANLLTRSIVFGDRRAADAMTPRLRVVSVDATDPVAVVVERAAASGHSRFPVNGEDVDDVVGFVHLKSALAVPRDERGAVLVREVMVAPVVVPSTLPAGALLDALQERGLQIAVVIDEYGGTDGIVTLEDLVEELVGEVSDEFDLPGVSDHDDVDGLVAEGDGWRVPGALRPDEVEAVTGLEVERGEWATVAGMFLAAFQAMPAVGDHVDVDGVRWTVRSLDGLRIDLLHAAPIAAAHASRDDQEVQDA